MVITKEGLHMTSNWKAKYVWAKYLENIGMLN